MVKGGERHFHKTDPCRTDTVPVPWLRDARPAGRVTYCSICASTMPRAQNRAGKGSILFWRRFTFPIFLFFICAPPPHLQIVSAITNTTFLCHSSSMYVNGSTGPKLNTISNVVLSLAACSWMRNERASSTVQYWVTVENEAASFRPRGVLWTPFWLLSVVKHRQVLWGCTIASEKEYSWSAVFRSLRASELWTFSP